MNIKQAAEQSGVSARNIRYYEQAGLLTPARNPENEYRIYSQADVRALKLIRMLRTLDMPVEEIGITHEGMAPRFMLDGIEYRAVRYSSHLRNIPILRVRCEVCDPSALAVESDPKRLRVQRLLHYGLPMLVGLALAVVWVCTRNMPLWPDKAAVLLVLGALGIGYGFRGWYLYYNDRDQ